MKGKVMPQIVLALGGVTLAIAAAAAQSALHPDAVYVNGTVITMDASSRTVEAFAVGSDTIVAVGSSSEVRQLAGPGTRIVDLQGKTVTPGFYAAHDHFPGAGIKALYEADLSYPPLGDVTTINKLIEVLRRKAAETPKGQWIQGRGYTQSWLEENRQPTRWELDKASPDHPIYITQSHVSVANSKALELAHVTKDTPQPKGGVIRKDPKTGEPDGVLEESAGSLVRRAIPPYSVDQTMDAIKWASNHYASKGVTTMVKASGSNEELVELQVARARGILPLRLVFMGRKQLGGQSPGEAGGFVTGFGDNMLKLGAVKLGQDGSIQGYTGYLSKPYHVPFKPFADKPADPTWRAYPHQNREELTGMVKELHRAGYQIGTHGNGDAGIDDIIAAYREAQRDFPRPDARHRIEHAQASREDQLDAMKELGITPSFYVGHVYYFGDRHRDVFLGPDRGSRISPLKSAVDRGIRFTIHDDTPVTPVNPLQLLWVSVNRLTSTGKVLGPEQRITPLQALRALTIDAAWQNFEENIKGSIEPSKLADFVVLAENPLTIDPIKIRDITILETVVGGKTVYQRAGGATAQ